MNTLFAFLSPSMPELLIVGIVALLLFGKRLPEVARSLGKGIVEFKKGVHGIEDDVDRATHSPPKSSASRPVPEEEVDEVTAPKFEPPQSAPSETKEANA
jgi:sec-independent protein translocase protein TatA